MYEERLEYFLSFKKGQKIQKIEKWRKKLKLGVILTRAIIDERTSEIFLSVNSFQFTDCIKLFKQKCKNLQRRHCII